MRIIRIASVGEFDLKIGWLNRWMFGMPRGDWERNKWINEWWLHTISSRCVVGAHSRHGAANSFASGFRQECAGYKGPEMTAPSMADMNKVFGLKGESDQNGCENVWNRVIAVTWLQSINQSHKNLKVTLVCFWGRCNSIARPQLNSKATNLSQESPDMVEGDWRESDQAHFGGLVIQWGIFGSTQNDNIKELLWRQLLLYISCFPKKVW